MIKENDIYQINLKIQNYENTFIFIDRVKLLV